MLSILFHVLPLAQTQLGTFKPPSSAFSQDSTTADGVLLNIDAFLSFLIGLITVIAGLFFVVSFITATLAWVTAGGDSGKISKARDQMLQGVIGLVIVVASYGLIGLIGTIVGLDLLSPTDSLRTVLQLGAS